MSPVTKDFFQGSSSDTTYYDEGPKPIVRIVISGSAIDTTQIDPWRQGVELTQQKHWDAGCVKISAGEPGHKLRKTRFGVDRTYRTQPTFQDIDYFKPIEYLRAQEDWSPLYFQSLTFPIITSDYDQIDNFILNGAIEPLTIRAVASFYSIDVPFESHSIKGGLQSGNPDSHLASDQLTSVSTYDASYHRSIPFLDMVDIVGGKVPLNGFFIFDQSKIKPFVDVRLLRNTRPHDLMRLTQNQPEGYETDMIVALGKLSGSTDEGYVRFDQRAAPCGWEYESTPLGADSIVFGGQTY